MPPNPPAIREIIISRPVAHCHRVGQNIMVVEHVGLDMQGQRWTWNTDIITCDRPGHTFETGTYDYQEVSSGNKTNS